MSDLQRRSALVLLIAGCPTVKEIGEKPEESTTSNAMDETESSGDETEPGSSSTGEMPVDGPVDCATIEEGMTVEGGPIGELGFPPPCSPRASGAGAWMCCSDDPAAVGGALPSYEGKGIEGDTPIFSGLNNAIGTSGLCVRTSDIPNGSALLEPQALNCPIPCNPTWDAGSIENVCGASRTCCQTQPIEPEDCIFDEEAQQWRPVTGDDIGEPTNWSPTSHATHQDPNGLGCDVFSGGMQQNFEAWEDCVRQLTVANQRGYCMALLPSQVCPHEQPGFIDACTQINMGLIPPPMQ